MDAYFYYSAIYNETVLYIATMCVYYMYLLHMNVLFALYIFFHNSETPLKKPGAQSQPVGSYHVICQSSGLLNSYCNILLLISTKLDKHRAMVITVSLNMSVRK
ncbi:hypothetical protein OTU49_017530 [Cherax quadricarinatus]|uniref:Uncharacterized protein n=1 Tax=Cherax quadricarinatus TaxID=27406 RepID=A0AAW0YFL0_CHEQU